MHDLSGIQALHDKLEQRKQDELAQVVYQFAAEQGAIYGLDNVLREMRSIPLSNGE